MKLELLNSESAKQLRLRDLVVGDIAIITDTDTEHNGHIVKICRISGNIMAIGMTDDTYWGDSRLSSLTVRLLEPGETLIVSR